MNTPRSDDDAWTYELLLGDQVFRITVTHDERMILALENATGPLSQRAVWLPRGWEPLIADAVVAAIAALGDLRAGVRPTPTPLLRLESTNECHVA